MKDVPVALPLCLVLALGPKSHQAKDGAGEEVGMGGVEREKCCSGFALRWEWSLTDIDPSRPNSCTTQGRKGLSSSAIQAV